MHPRPVLLAVIVLGVVSLGLLIGSVALAFGVGPQGAIYHAETELPESLFAIDPESEVAPVAEVIAADVDQMPLPSPGAQAAKVSPSPAKRKVEGENPVRPAQMKMTLGFSSEVIGKGKGRKIRYTAVMANVGEAGISNISFSSHVPDATEWTAGSCAAGTKELLVSRDGVSPSQVCADPTRDTDGHDVHHVLAEALSPGGTVTVTFTVVVVDETALQVVDHAHARAAGLDVSSGDVITELR